MSLDPLGVSSGEGFKKSTWVDLASVGSLVSNPLSRL